MTIPHIVTHMTEKIGPGELVDTIVRGSGDNRNRPFFQVSRSLFTFIWRWNHHCHVRFSLQMRGRGQARLRLDTRPRPHIVTFDPGTYEGWTTQVDKNLEHQTGSNEATQHFIRCHQRYLSRVGVGKASAMYGLTQNDIRRGTKKPNNATFHWYPTFWSLDKHNFHDRLVLPERGFPVYNIYGAKSSRNIS